MARPIGVYLEVGQKKVFACAQEWPGWCRSAKDEAGALEALGAYTGRYGAVVGDAGLRLPSSGGFEVVERVKGSATTDFGAPGTVPQADLEPLTAAAARRQVALVEASWAVLDRVAAGAPARLRKGPRGGGRDRDQVVQHVLAAEASYARKLGVRHPEPSRDDAEAVAALRGDIAAALLAARTAPPPEEKRWPARYAARRIAWHVLDHAWEIEDKSDA